MREITIQTYPIEKSKLLDTLKRQQIQLNAYARQIFQNSAFCTEHLPPQLRFGLLSLEELGLSQGAKWQEILDRAADCGLQPCKAAAAVFLRLSLSDQQKSKNSILTGQHRSPDGAVVVFSEPLEGSDSFPRGLYLRNVDGQLWLRGYVCDDDYLWPADTIFAFLKP